MPDSTPAAAGQAPAAAEPQVGAPIAPIVPPAAETTPAATPETPAVDGREKELSDTRAEAARYRRQLRETETRLKAIEESQLSDSEKLQKRVSEMETQLAEKDRQVRSSQVEALAARLGVSHPDAAVKLIDWQRVEDGEPIEKVVTDLLVTYPFLKAAAPGAMLPNVSATNPARGTSAPVAFTRAQIGDYNFFTQNRDAIMAAVREGRITD